MKDIIQISKSLAQKDYLRLLMVYFSCFDLAKKDKDTLVRSIENETHRMVL